ncbi:MAG: T9SS type A sorting domain-containing protein, partial [Saprospiraceae bacterium]
VGTPCRTNIYELPFVIEASFLYVDFDSTDLEFIAYGGAVFEKVANPSPSGINLSDRVGRVNKTFGAEPFAGVEADVYEIALDIRPVMTQKVFSRETGVVRFMLDDETTGAPRLKIDMDYGSDDVNQWVQLVYDFTGEPAAIYDQLRLTYNHGSTTTEFWYFDDVMGQTDLNLSNGTDVAITEVIAVYPNPSLGMFSLDTKDIFPAGNTYDLDVLDIQGRPVFRQQVLAQGQLVALDLSDQPTGMYFLRLSGQLLHYVKVIKK